MAKIALLVGVSEYQSGFQPLASAAKDIEAMQRVLQNPEIGEFAPANITLLLNQQRQDTEEAIYHLFVNRHKDDLLLFYFSGHGITDSRGKLYLATPTTCKDSKRGRLVKPTAVAASFIHECMNDSASQRQIVILDCCFSGAFAKGMIAKDDGTVNIIAQLGGKGRAILTSSNSIEYSFHEKESELSIYTRYLVEGLETGVADYDNDGSISVDELHDYASSKVKETSPAMTPQFYPVEEGYRIKLAKAPVVDYKLKYRKEVEKIIHEEEGEIDFINRVVLDELAHQLGLTKNEVATIEAEVLEPYQQRQNKLQRYEQVFSEVIQQHYPLGNRERTKLKRLQQVLNLRDEDVEPIERKIDSRQKQSSIPEVKQTKVQNKSIPPLSSPSPQRITAPEVELLSERGVDYTRLRDILAAKKWKEADRETGSVMLKACGKDDKSYLNPSDMAKFPCLDLNTINKLWLHYSNGHFGFTVQKRIYEEAGRDYPKLCDRIGWRVGENWVSYATLNWNNDAAITASEGHLPVDISASWKPGPTAILETKMITLFSRLETCNISESESDVELYSTKGVTYIQLRDLLAAGKWKEADQETAIIMLNVAGQQQKGWLNKNDIKQFPCADLLTINQLWLHYSKKHFGWSIQIQLWESVGGKPGDYDYETYKQFGGRVGWYINDQDNWLGWDELTFSLDAPKGHLPGLKKLSQWGVATWDIGEMVWQGEYLSTIAKRLTDCSAKLQ